MIVDIIIASDQVTQIASQEVIPQSGYKVKLVMVNRDGESDAFWGIMMIRRIRYQISG